MAQYMKLGFITKEFSVNTKFGFTLFDKKAGKIVARYQQVFGIKALIERVTSFDEQGARNGGVIWHTQGSGKTALAYYSLKYLLDYFKSKKKIKSYFEGIARFFCYGQYNW